MSCGLGTGGRFIAEGLKSGRPAGDYSELRSLPLSNNEVRDAPGIPQPMPGAWATSLFLPRKGEGRLGGICQTIVRPTRPC